MQQILFTQTTCDQDIRIQWQNCWLELTNCSSPKCHIVIFNIDLQNSRVFYSEDIGKTPLTHKRNNECESESSRLTEESREYLIKYCCSTILSIKFSANAREPFKSISRLRLIQSIELAVKSGLSRRNKSIHRLNNSNSNFVKCIWCLIRIKE